MACKRSSVQVRVAPPNRVRLKSGPFSFWRWPEVVFTTNFLCARQELNRSRRKADLRIEWFRGDASGEAIAETPAQRSRERIESERVRWRTDPVDFAVQCWVFSSAKNICSSTATPRSTTSYMSIALNMFPIGFAAMWTLGSVWKASRLEFLSTVPIHTSRGR